MRQAFSRSTVGAAVIAATAIGLGACSGSGTPHVASLGVAKTDRATTTTTLPKGNATQLLDEWAGCMRNHGDPGQIDPTVDANGVIHITLPATGGAAAALGKGSATQSPCAAYLTAASTALRGGEPLPKPDPAKLEKYAQCMRANGIPDFPDPTGGGLSIQVHPGSDLDPHSPTFQNAAKLCSRKTGVLGVAAGGQPPRGAIEATSGNGPPGGAAGSGGSGHVGIATGGSGG